MKQLGLVLLVTGMFSDATVIDSETAEATSDELVVTATDELEQAKTIAEGVRQERDLAPDVSHDPALQDGSGAPRAGDRSIDVRHHEIEVHRSPVARVAALPPGI